MKKIKILLPLLCYITVTITYKALVHTVLADILGYDQVLYIDGREERRFGIGAFSQIFIALSFLLAIIFNIVNAKKCLSKNKSKPQFVCSMIFIMLIYGFWAMHYAEWYPIFSWRCFVTLLHKMLGEFMKLFFDFKFSIVKYIIWCRGIVVLKLTYNI